MLQMCTSTGKCDLHISKHRSRQNAPMLSFQHMRQDQSLPVLVQHILTADRIDRDSTSRFSRFQYQMHFRIMTQRLKMPYSFNCIFNRFFINNIPASKRNIHVKAFFYKALQNLRLHFAHQLNLDLSCLFIPDYTEHRIFFLQLPEILQHPVYITSFRQLHPIIQNRLQYRCRRTLLHPKPLSRISPGKSCHSTDTAFFCFLHHLVLVPGINPDLVNFLLHRFFLCHIFQDFFNLQYSVCDLHMCQTAAL